MKLSKSSQYALHAAMEMAVHDGPVRAAMVAAKYRIPEGALAHALQGLVRAGLCKGMRGQGGGYLLARSPKTVTVLDVIAVFDPVVSTSAPEPPPAATLAGRLQALFAEVDEVAANTFASVTLATLTQGLPRQTA